MVKEKTEKAKKKKGKEKTRGKGGDKGRKGEGGGEEGGGKMLQRQKNFPVVMSLPKVN